MTTFDPSLISDERIEQLCDEYDDVPPPYILQYWQTCNGNIEDVKACLNAAFGKRRFGSRQKIKIWTTLNNSQKKIIRETMGRVFHNILRDTNDSKYRRFSVHALDKVLARQCEEQSVNPEPVLKFVVESLRDVGFTIADDHWRFDYDAPILPLWDLYRLATQNHQIRVRDEISAFINGIWANYSIVMDFNEHSIILLGNEGTVHLNIAQGRKYKEENHKKFLLDVSVESWNDFSELENSESKWNGVTVNGWKFRGFPNENLHYFPSQCALFNAFRVRWRDICQKTYNMITVNPYSMTLNDAIAKIEHELKVVYRFEKGFDEIKLELLFEACTPKLPKISKDVGKNILMHDIYKSFKNYPNMTVTWVIVSKGPSISTERTISTRSSIIENNQKPAKIRTQFNPFLSGLKMEPFNTNLSKLFSNVRNELYHIQDDDISLGILKWLFYELISNGYLCDLIPERSEFNESERAIVENEIKRTINYNIERQGTLQLNEEILIILKQAKKLFHSTIHKHMGYPLYLYHICALILYCEKSCAREFNQDQISFTGYKWMWLDHCLGEAIDILCYHERREEFDGYLYCGLHRVKIRNLESEIMGGIFTTCVSTSNDLQVARLSLGRNGCLVKFHPSMRRAQRITSCDASWISSSKNCSEILFAKPNMKYRLKEEEWVAIIESEQDDIQTILLTSYDYNIHRDQIINISTIYNDAVDLNIIWLVLEHFAGDTEKTTEFLAAFQEYKNKSSDISNRYKEIESEFKKRRCCNDSVNIFTLYMEKKQLIDNAIDTSEMWHRIGLPWSQEERLWG